MKNLETLLIVDDEAVNLTVMSKILTQHFVVRAANSGTRCLEIVKSDPRPDLILLDIQMPDMNGYAVLEKLQQNPETCDIPVIFVTASEAIEDEEKGLDLGAVDFIVKPIRPAILLARIKTHLLVKQAELCLREQKTSLEVKVTNNEQRLKHIIEAVPAAIYETLLPDLKLSFLDSRVKHLVGIGKEDFNKGDLNWYEQIHQEDQTRIKTEILTTAQQQRAVFQLEYQINHADGKSIVWFEDNGTVEYDSTGKAVRILGALINVNKRKEVEQKLLESFDATIKAVSSALEKRDPYTAGHQNNCARIAKAIAEELGIDEDMIKGIYQAAAIHDIGKIYLPSEILNKPSKLSNAEFGLIKTHAQVGYDIIKDVKFPWPIAQTVLQHHERIDGSGYPNGCKADEICIEAKILAVADVVDAMSSDRPYRKGLGIEAALSEIEQNAALSYDETIVKACLVLFREKNFSIQNE